MQVLTKKIVTVQISMEEYDSINNMICILKDICCSNDEETPKNIEMEWRNRGGLTCSVEDVLFALEILRDLDETE